MAREICARLAALSTQTLMRAARASWASSASLAGPTTSLLMWMSRTPAATKGRASLTF